ncbi:unnamed protein product, partial [Closterium sp. NIES-53]
MVYHGNAAGRCHVAAPSPLTLSPHPLGWNNGRSSVPRVSSCVRSLPHGAAVQEATHCLPAVLGSHSSSPSLSGKSPIPSIQNTLAPRTPTLLHSLASLRVPPPHRLLRHSAKRNARSPLQAERVARSCCRGRGGSGCRAAPLVTAASDGAVRAVSATRSGLFCSPVSGLRRGRKLDFTTDADGHPVFLLSPSTCTRTTSSGIVQIPSRP